MANLLRLFRLSHSSAHLYTTDIEEKNAAVEGGWSLEGVQALVMNGPVPGTIPLYRCRRADGNDYLYTTNADEVRAATSDGAYISEGTACFVWQAPIATATRLHRLRNTADHGIHMYTTSSAELGHLLQIGWVEEAFPVYVLPPNLDFSVTFEGLAYGDLIEKIHAPVLMDEHLYSNPADSKATLSRTFAFAQSKTARFEWGLNDSLNIDIGSRTSIEGSVGVPGIAAGGKTHKLTMNVGGNAGSEGTWQAIEQQSISFDETVRIAPGASGTISGSVDWAHDAEAPFSLAIRVAARLGAKKVPGPEVAEILLAIQPGLTIALTDTNQVMAQLSGAFVGAFGLRTSTTVTPTSGPSPLFEVRLSTQTDFAA